MGVSKKMSSGSKSFRKLIKEDRPLLGTILQNPRPEVAEIFATIGFDWLFLDMEHGLISTQDAANILMAVDNVLPCVVRVSSNNESEIKRALDLGATGIVIPLIKDVEDARLAVSYCRYPPLGQRSLGITRAQRFDLRYREYMSSANSSVAVIIQIEHRKAIQNFNQIIEVDGIDGIFVGPYDLSGSMGYPGEIDHPEVVSTINYVIDKSKSRGIARCIYSHTVEHLKNYLKKGYNAIALSADHITLARAGKENYDRFHELIDGN